MAFGPSRFQRSPNASPSTPYTHYLYRIVTGAGNVGRDSSASLAGSTASPARSLDSRPCRVRHHFGGFTLPNECRHSIEVPGDHGCRRHHHSWRDHCRSSWGLWISSSIHPRHSCAHPYPRRLGLDQPIRSTGTSWDLHWVDDRPRCRCHFSWQVARRYAVGAMGPLDFLGRAKWTPPGGWLVVTLLAASGLVLLGIAGLVGPGTVGKNPVHSDGPSRTPGGKPSQLSTAQPTGPIPRGYSVQQPPPVTTIPSAYLASARRSSSRSLSFASPGRSPASGRASTPSAPLLSYRSSPLVRYKTSFMRPMSGRLSSSRLGGTWSCHLLGRRCLGRRPLGRRLLLGGLCRLDAGVQGIHEVDDLRRGL